VQTSISSKTNFEIAGLGEEVTADVSYTFSSSKSQSQTQEATQQFSLPVTVEVPAGKKYRVVMTATVLSFQVPYTATIAVDGTTETWFEDEVQGHYNWSADAGTLFGWINLYGTAGGDSHLYQDTGNGKGAVTISGTLNGQLTCNFDSHVQDITGNEPDPSQQAGSGPAGAAAQGQQPGYGPGNEPDPSQQAGQGPQDPHGQDPQDPYGQGPQDPYGQGPQDPYGQGPQDPYGQGPQDPGQGPQGGYEQGGQTVQPQHD
jgi:hypothetical protein